MRQADKAPEDEQPVGVVYEAPVKCHAKCRTRGGLGTPAEVVLRMLLLKHLRNRAFDAVEREVRANLPYRVYREFTRAGGGKAREQNEIAINRSFESTTRGPTRRYPVFPYAVSESRTQPRRRIGFVLYGDLSKPNTVHLVLW
jgi:hypothetical protein